MTECASETATPGQPVLERERRGLLVAVADHAARCGSRPSRRAARALGHRRVRAGASRGTGRTDAGCPTRPPCSRTAAIVSTRRQPGRDRRARGTRRSGRRRAVLTSSPTMTVSPAGAGVARLERAIDPVVVGDREVGQPALAPRPGRRRLRATAERIEAAPTCGSGGRRTPGSCGVAAAAVAPRGHRHQICWTSDFLKKSKCSSARPVPRATQLSGFSATWHGHAGDLGQQLVDVAQERAAAGHDHALVDDVGARAPAASARGRSGPRRRAAGAAPRSPP